MNTRIKKVKKGFTLLEILLVIAAIGILAAIVLVAINPNRQIAQVRNAQRRSDINTIYKALEQYLIDNKDYPEGIGNTSSPICDTGTEQSGGTTDCADKVDLRVLVPIYLASIPKDPSGGVYKVYINPENNRIGVESPGVELGQSLVVNPISTPPPLVTATGGNITTINENGIWYKVHTFTTNGIFTVTTGGTVEYLVVAGGGGGGSVVGGGGGGGGVVSNTGTVAETTLAITIGQGGVPNTNGGNSAFGSITAYGGGGGGNWDVNGLNGGSGGGAGSHEYFTIMNPGTGIQGQGYSGGNSQICTSSGCTASAGGGGGAGSVGGNSPSLGTGGNGGNGIQWPAGSGIYYAGGGGGGCRNCYAGQSGSGIHGGGNGGVAYANRNGTAGTANTGGGGGGAGLQNTGDDGSGVAGNGGSGIVIIRYTTTAPTIVQNGLVLHLDAGNPASYPGEGNTWFDLSGNGNNGSLTPNISGPIFSSANGGSLSFDGVDDHVNSTSISSQFIADITVEAWIYLSSHPGDWVRIIGTGGNGGNRTFGLWYNGPTGGRILWQRYGAGDPGIFPVSPSLSTGKWHHIVATTLGSSHILYLNASSIGTSTASGPWPASGENITIGFAGFHTRHNGSMSNLRLYNRALTPEEVQQNFNATIGRFGL